MTTPSSDIAALLEDEWYLVRYSGEIPEVALHMALFHLTEDRDGPQLHLAEDQLAVLLGAAEQRYLEITLRDLQPANRTKSIYRGVQRSFINWQRLQLFCRRHGRDGAQFRGRVAEALLSFLEREIEDRERFGGASCINCSFAELTAFARQLGVERRRLPRGVEHYCR